MRRFVALPQATQPHRAPRRHPLRRAPPWEGHPDRETNLTRTVITIGALTLVAGAGAAALFATQSRGAQTDQHLALAQARTQVRTLRAQLAAERRHHRRAIARAGRAHGRPSVDHALTVAAAAYGVPKARLRAIARCESTLVPTARNGPYSGLFQFGAPLWSKTPYGRLSRTDPYAASLAAAWAFSRGMDRNWPVCGYR